MDAWSARKFAQGAINTWPFEHEYILAYRGTSREIFFPKEHSTSQKRYSGGRDIKLASVLKTRYLIPENSNGNSREDPFESWKKWYIQEAKEEGLDKDEAENAWREFLKADREKRNTRYDEQLDARQAGNFFAPRIVVEENSYYRPDKTEDILLKVMLPTNKVTVINRLPSSDNIRSESLSDIRDLYTKQQFREECRAATQQRNNKTNERIQYATGEIGLENLEGVEDRECAEQFVSLGNYIRWLRKECVWEMEKFSFTAQAESSIKSQIEFLDELEHLLRKADYYLEILDEERRRFIEIINEHGQRPPEYKARRREELKAAKNFFSTAIRCMEEDAEGIKGPGYTQVRKNIYRLLEKQTNYFSSRDRSAWNRNTDQSLEARFNLDNVSGSEDLFKRIPEFRSTIESLEEEIEEIRQEEESRAKHKEWDRKELEDERDFELKVDRRLADGIFEMPNLVGISDHIEENYRDLDKELSELKKGVPERSVYLGREM